MDRRRSLPAQLGSQVLRGMQRIKLLAKFLPDEDITVQQDFTMKDGTVWTLRLTKKHAE